MNRIWRYATAAFRWYLSPSGLLFGVAVTLLGLGLLPMDWSWAFTLTGLVFLAAFIPYRFSRQQSRGDRLIGQLRREAWKSDRTNGEAIKQVRAELAGATRADGAIARTRRDLAERIAVSERGIANRMASDRYEFHAHLQSTIDELHAVVAAAQRVLSESDASQRRSLADNTEQMRQSTSRLSESVESIRSAVNEILAAQDGLNAALRDERSRRIIGFARRDSTGVLPARVAIIVAVPRSGSTWSFDMFRTMPSVFVEPSVLIWDRLGLRGRRYPAGLSDSSSASIDVEVAHGVGAEIEALLSGEPRNPVIAIEKLHPEFFGFSPRTLDHAISRLESENVTLVPIYQVRNPVEVMWSFARYKQRDEAWYRQVPMEEIPGFVRRTLESIEELITIRPGFIVDFSDLNDDRAVADLFTFVDPTVDVEIAFELVKRARLVTSRELRVEQQRRPFLGNTVSTSSIDIAGPEGAWTGSERDIAICHEVYERLLAQRDTPENREHRQAN